MTDNIHKLGATLSPVTGRKYAPGRSPKETIETLAAEIAENPEILQDVIIFGYDADGCLFVRSSQITRAHSLWLIKVAEQDILHGGGQPDDE